MPNVSELKSNKQSAGPNIVLITIDTLRADHLSCYGYDRETTPFIDQLAKQGAMFTRDDSASSWTKPAIASLFSSLYPSGHHTNSFSGRLPESVNTLPEVLKKNGYLTMAFSANSQILPVFGFAQGFDYFYSNIINSSTYYTIISRLLDVLNKIIRVNLDLVRKTRFNLPAGAYTDKTLVNNFKKTVASARKRPYFAYFHFNSPHNPFMPPPPYDEKFTDPKWRNIKAREISFHFYENTITCDENISGGELANIINLYDGEIAFTDDLLRELYYVINQDNKRETLIIITADHGEEFYEHCRFGHGHSLYRELLRVPLIIYFPAKVPAGSNISLNVSNVDIAPTILSLVGLPSEQSFMGKNLTPLIEHPDSNAAGYEPESFSELIRDHITQTSLIRENCKIIYTNTKAGDSEELFNLDQDPHEKNNLLNILEFNAIRQNLKSRLDANLLNAAKTNIKSEDIELNEDLKEKLKALGYIK